MTDPLTVWREMESLLAIPKRENLVLLVALGYRKHNPGMNNDRFGAAAHG